MKFAFALFIIFVSLSSLAAPLELSFKERFEAPKVVLDDSFLFELIHIRHDFNLEARMIAGSKTKKKAIWGEGLREKLQGAGCIIRL